MAKLSQVNPDFPAMVEQLQNELSTKEAWVDLLEAGTGQTMIEFQSGVGTLLHYCDRESCSREVRVRDSLYWIHPS